MQTVSYVALLSKLLICLSRAVINSAILSLIRLFESRAQSSIQLSKLSVTKSECNVSSSKMCICNAITKREAMLHLSAWRSYVSQQSFFFLFSCEASSQVTDVALEAVILPVLCEAGCERFAKTTT